MPTLVRDVMTNNVTLVRSQDTIAQAAELMRDRDIGALPVGENDRLVGMLTDRDIVTRTTAERLPPQSTPVGNAMSKSVLYCFDDEPCETVAASMAGNQVRRLPVVDRQKRLVGIVALGDLAIKGAQEPASQALSVISRPARRRPHPR